MEKYTKDISELEHIVKKYGQQHLLDFCMKLEGNERTNFLEDMSKIDYELVKKLYDKTEGKNEKREDEISPIECIDKYKLNDRYKGYEEVGKKAIREGKIAAVTMAGGQGTRLGHPGPKGTYDIGLESHKSLFELLIDNLKEGSKKYNVDIPWFIMTSEENHEETTSFFHNHKYFGYEENKNIFFFKQGQLPMIDTEGRILIGEDKKIKQAADGHGGIYETLVKTKMTEIMRQKGIEWVFIGGVDNCLAKMADPLLIGVAIEEGVTVACKSIIKANAHEQVGVFCKRNGKPSVIEYSEISDEMAERVNSNGELTYGESHILCNLFNVDAIERMGAELLPYHAAYKKATFINNDGEVEIPTSPNAYKFEAFLFDAFGAVDEMAILRVKREEEFAPVKNTDDAGVDSPSTARKLYIDYYKKD